MWPSLFYGYRSFGIGVQIFVGRSRKKNESRSLSAAAKKNWPCEDFLKNPKGRAAIGCCRATNWPDLTSSEVTLICILAQLIWGNELRCGQVTVGQTTLTLGGMQIRHPPDANYATGRAHLHTKEGVSVSRPARASDSLFLLAMFAKKNRCSFTFFQRQPFNDVDGTPHLGRQAKKNNFALIGLLILFGSILICFFYKPTQKNARPIKCKCKCTRGSRGAADVYRDWLETGYCFNIFKTKIKPKCCYIFDSWSGTFLYQFSFAFVSHFGRQLSAGKFSQKKNGRRLQTTAKNSTAPQTGIDHLSVIGQ